MWVLALDTTTREGSVAVVRDDTVVVVRPGTPDRSHAQRVPSDLRDALAAAGVTLTDIDLFAVASGPGAFTGLRIGLAATQGLGLATSRPTIGIPALDAWAWGLLAEHAGTVAGAWLDAARGEVFAAAYRTVQPSADPPWPLDVLAPATVDTPDATLSAWRDVVPRGTPVALVGASAAANGLMSAGYRTAVPTPLAALVGRLAVRAHHAGASGPPAALAPVYVRRPDVEIERDRRREAAPSA